MKRLFNAILFAAFLLGACLVSERAQAHIDNAMGAFDRLSALANR